MKQEDREVGGTIKKLTHILPFVFDIIFHVMLAATLFFTCCYFKDIERESNFWSVVEFKRNSIMRLKANVNFFRISDLLSSSIS